MLSQRQRYTLFIITDSIQEFQYGFDVTVIRIAIKPIELSVACAPRDVCDLLIKDHITIRWQLREKPPIA